MMLTGSLIPISGGVLSLLGIAGAATVLTKVKESNKAMPSVSTDPPREVSGPALKGPRRAIDICVA
jgi:hypothetical protein